MIYKILLTSSLFAFLAGCASAPADIAPAMVDTSAYKGMTCEGLLLAAQNEGVNLESVSKDQRAAVSVSFAKQLVAIPSLFYRFS
jgi:hypothetical protein